MGDYEYIEKQYDASVLKELAKYRNSLYAVSIKGVDNKEFQRNTGKELDETLFWDNLEKLWRYEVPFYLTFTGMSSNSISKFKSQIQLHFPNDWERVLEDSFAINLIKYKALDQN